MLQKILLCLLFILTSSVMANAAPLNSDLGIVRIEPNTWRATHAGELQLDGIPVVAALQSVEKELEIPSFLADKLQTLVPLNTAPKKSFRLLIAAVEKPSLRAQFTLEGKVVSINGVNQFAYVSKDSTDDFQFLIVADNNDQLQVSYRRMVQGTEVEQGAFTLAPLPQIL